MRIEPLPVPAGEAVLDLLPAIAGALAGGAPLLPYAAGSPLPDPPTQPGLLPSSLAVVVGTSGSTGVPKLAMLTADALIRSAAATHEVLGGPGTWLLAMPAHHVAGLQVLIRSVHAASTPTVQDLSGGFTAGSFTAAAARHLACDTERPHYTALVPAQVSRLLDEPAAADVLAAYDAVLVGGAGTPATVRERALDAGIRLVPTYGMSETAGGCVYAGRPLPGAAFRVEGGRVLLGGATLAAGYLGRPDLTELAFITDEDGRRWFRTDDAGEVGDDDRLHVLGRLDDIINTGGLKVSPRVVEEAILRHLPGVREAVVVGVPDPRWGQAVCAAVLPDRSLTGRLPDRRSVRAALRGHLPVHALPQRVLALDAVPARGPGKPDRAAVIALFAMGD